MRYVTTGTVLALALACATPGQAANPQKLRQGLQEFKREAKTGPGARLGANLLALQKAYGAGRTTRDQPRRVPGMLRIRDGYVSVSAFGADPAALRSQLVSKGMLDATVHKSSVSGRVPVTALADLANTSGLKLMKAAMPMTRAGVVTSQGDRSVRSNVARSHFGVNGRGVRIGVLSDSFDCVQGPFEEGQRFTRAAEDIAKGDLPSNTHILKDYLGEGCSDEGRAMMQIIHDVAPGSPLSFYTAAESEEDFANGILALAADGAKVIVDDVGYPTEPMFENGIIADAVNTVKKQGVAYFSAAGNEARQSYESKFRAAENPGLFGVRHDFAAGPAVDTLQKVMVPTQGDTGVILNWDEPSLSANGAVGSRSDVDVLFYNMDGTPVVHCLLVGPEDTYCQWSGTTYNVGGDAMEIAEIINVGDPVEVQIGIEVYEGPHPNLVKYIWMDLAEPMIVEEFDTASGSTFGHPNAEGAEAVGAAWWFDTAAFGAANHPRCNNACVNSYSSAGGTPILFDEAGQRRKYPFIGFKPGVTGPDGVNTSFFLFNQTTPAPGEPDSFPNFFGTSAAAAHVAAVAALILDQRARDIAAHKRFLGPKQLSPDLIYAVLRLTAEDIRSRSLATRDPTATERIRHSGGFDFDSGFGLVNAKNALRLTAGF